ncbi:MAG: NAD(P)/FAD-dependent oxidoreductase [Nocardioides sp.]
MSDVAVVGAGAVGTAIALALSTDHTVVVIDSGDTSLRGASGHSPGYITHLLDSEYASELAELSSRVLVRMTAGDDQAFTRLGSVELAVSAGGAELVADRARRARTYGLTCRSLDARELAQTITAPLDLDRVHTAVHYPADAIATGQRLCARLRERAEGNGVRFRWQTHVTSLRETGRRVAVETDTGRITADHVVVCTGSWTPELLSEHETLAPLAAIRHPFIHGRTGLPDPGQQPFFRLPELRTYGGWDGRGWCLGTRAHHMRLADPGSLPRAEVPWDGAFEPDIANLAYLFSDAGALTISDGVDGIFPATPDGLPYVGPLRPDGPITIAVGSLITHTGAVAAIVASLLRGGVTPVSIAELAPDRFDHLTTDQALARCLHTYNGYAQQTAPVLIQQSTQRRDQSRNQPSYASARPEGGS